MAKDFPRKFRHACSIERPRRCPLCPVGAPGRSADQDHGRVSWGRLGLSVCRQSRGRAENTLQSHAIGLCPRHKARWVTQSSPCAALGLRRQSPCRRQYPTSGARGCSRRTSHSGEASGCCWAAMCESSGNPGGHARPAVLPSWGRFCRAVLCHGEWLSEARWLLGAGWRPPGATCCHRRGIVGLANPLAFRPRVLAAGSARSSHWATRGLCRSLTWASLRSSTALVMWRQRCATPLTTPRACGGQWPTLSEAPWCTPSPASWLATCLALSR